MNATFEELSEGVVQLTAWAEAKGILGDTRVTPVFDEIFVQDVFRRTSLQAATSALQDRHISYIGLNEQNSSIVIYLEKVLRRADRDALQNVGRGNFNVEFLHSPQLQSGSVPGASPTLPYESFGDKYPCGNSVSVANEHAAGTIGCLLKDKAGEIYALSCNHVFAGNNYSDINIPVIAPGQMDIRANGLDPSTIGHLHSAIPLIDGNHRIVDAASNVDAAVIRVSAINYVSSMQRSYYDTPIKVAPPTGNMIVEKIGRTTGRTTGKITSFHPTPQDVRCNIMRHNTFKIVPFINYWGVTSQAGAFSLGGDSGSLVSTRLPDGTMAAVGMVFAGGANLSFIFPIQPILMHFGMDILSGHNVTP